MKITFISDTISDTLSMVRGMFRGIDIQFYCCKIKPELMMRKPLWRRIRKNLIMFAICQTMRKIDRGMKKQASGFEFQDEFQNLIHEDQVHQSALRDGER